MSSTRSNRADWTRSPTALTAALERAVATRNRQLERQVLGYLGAAGIVVVDRHALLDAVAGDRVVRSTTRTAIDAAPSLVRDGAV